MATPRANVPVTGPEPGWRSQLTPSLAEVSCTVPVRASGWWRKALAFAGPGYLNPARLHYFAEQGLTPGVLLTVSERQPFNGPTTIALVPSGDPRVVGRELAQLLWCRALGT